MEISLTNKKICERIKAIRSQEKLTGNVFANNIGISQGYLSDIENAKASPGKTLLLAISHVYNINIHWLYSGKGEMLRGPEVALQDESLAQGEWDEKSRITTKEGDPYEKTHGQDVRMPMAVISKEQQAANRAREENASLYNDRELVENVPERELKDKLIRTLENLISTQGDLITQLKTRLTGIEGQLQELSEGNKKTIEESKKIVKEYQEIKRRLKAAEYLIRLGDPEDQREEILKKRAV